MCYFITATLSSGADVVAVAGFAREHGLRWERLEHSGFDPWLDEGESYYLTTAGNCDCGTHFGVAHRQPPPVDLGRRCRKLARKGWSEEKIARWRAGQESARARSQALLADLRVHGSAEAGRWYDFMNDTIGEGAASGIGVLLHYYSGDVERENIPLQRREAVSLVDTAPPFLFGIDENVLYVFGRAAAGREPGDPAEQRASA